MQKQPHPFFVMLTLFFFVVGVLTVAAAIYQIVYRYTFDDNYRLTALDHDLGVLSPFKKPDSPWSLLLYPGSTPELPRNQDVMAGRSMVVRAMTFEEIKQACGADALACADVGLERINVPNPCFYTSDPYAVVMCHEMAHLNGWKHEKEGKWRNVDPLFWPPIGEVKDDGDK